MGEGDLSVFAACFFWLKDCKEIRWSQGVDDDDGNVDDDDDGGDDNDDDEDDADTSLGPTEVVDRKLYHRGFHHFFFCSPPSITLLLILKHPFIASPSITT